MKVPVNKNVHVRRMEELINAPSNVAFAAAAATAAASSQQNHNGSANNGGGVAVAGVGLPSIGGINVSLNSNNKHQANSNVVVVDTDIQGPGGPAAGIVGGQPPSKEQNLHYTMPGVLHYLQHEWARFELERSQWELDRAEFQARIAFLQGERKGQENLKTDLVRRIKMLEFALKQERAKYHKLKYGTDLIIPGDGKPFEEGSICATTENQLSDNEAPFTSVNNISWRQGRQLLRQYLQEIGYTDTIIDVRSNRVKSLLGLNNNTDSEETNTQGLTGNQRCNLSSKLRTSAGVCRPTSMAEAMIMKTEAAVMANFEFLAHTDIDIEEDENDGEEEIYDSNTDSKQNKVSDNIIFNSNDFNATSIMLGEDVDAEAEEVLNELNLLTEHEEAIIHVDMDTSNWNAVHRGMQSDPRRPGEESGSSLGLGELAQLTVNNDAEAAYDANNEEPLRKSWNAKYTLRSHFDGVRALVFHPTEPVLITGSDDHTLKLWNLQKTVPAKKSASLDVEPLYTFRSHTGPVLCLAMDNTGSHCYSGGLDSKIHCWTLPPANIDPYDSYDPSLLSQTFTGHTDAVWGLSMCHSHSQLLSVSADGTVKLWSLSSKVPLLNTYTSERDRNPTSVDFIRDEPHKLVVAYEEACVIYDAETGVVVSRLSGNEIQGVNRLVAHPILSLVVAANEDRHIRFYDHRSASLVHAMVAHLDAVTSLAVDPNGLYLLSGSHDCSIRLWNMDNKTCVQEITAHRKKFDESILDVAFHPSRPFIASAGADALAKVFV
ncbi:striatin-4 isoform X2 [Copidosoma floridanum]|uniref:striatin-4 isoform X2 n=1 Tax=Copidosoma floridanum TaxID=29053 RepID=UPI0006C95F9F|nr:striatin-4 isoform X2 [Copidosoma floridanum]